MEVDVVVVDDLVETSDRVVAVVPAGVFDTVAVLVAVAAADASITVVVVVVVVVAAVVVVDSAAVAAVDSVAAAAAAAVVVVDSTAADALGSAFVVALQVEIAVSVVDTYHY